MSGEKEVAVGKLMILFGERMRQDRFRRAIYTKKDFLKNEVQKIMKAAGAER